ncbi:MAG: NUDIX domain-containing protein [Burkholderiales bacterium]|nr:NUDIX domain-containing protein [Burkholderiales bacterium]
MNLFPPKRLSCGIVIFSDRRELLLCHVTGHDHWDLPKGGARAGESPRRAALRETQEETGLRLPAERLLDLGRFDFGPKKDLHLFATRLPRFDVATLRCESHFTALCGTRRLPEMDGYGWFGFDHVPSLCPPKLSALLTGRLDLAGLHDTLGSQPGLARAA